MLTAAVRHHAETGDRAREDEAAALLAARDAMAAQSPTGTVDPFSFELERFRIAHAHARPSSRRDAMVQRLPRLCDLVLDWLDAHTSWASHDDRFQGATPAETQRNIERARECNPGFYAIRVRSSRRCSAPTSRGSSGPRRSGPNTF